MSRSPLSLAVTGVVVSSVLPGSLHLREPVRFNPWRLPNSSRRKATPSLKSQPSPQQPLTSKESILLASVSVRPNPKSSRLFGVVGRQTLPA